VTPQPSLVPLPGTDPRHLRRASYGGRVGDDFEVGPPRGRLSTLRLDHVIDLVGLEGRDDAFGLVFSGPRGIGSGTHKFRHPTLGTFELHISPVGPRRPRGQEYEAIVNRSRGVRRRLPMPRPRPR
jgi:hypothetical protein